MRNSEFLEVIKGWAGLKSHEQSHEHLESLSYVGTTLDNYYIPLLALATGELVVHENKRVIIYETFGPAYFQNRVRNVGASLGVYHYYLLEPYCTGFIFTGTQYIAQMGSLFDHSNNVPLFILTVRRENFWKFIKNPSLEGMTFIVSRAFLEDKQYSALRAKLKPYLTFLQEQEIPFLIVPNIVKFCFNAPITLPKFKTVKEKVDYFSNLHNFIYKQVKPQETSDNKKARLSQEAERISVPTTVTETSLPFDFA